MPTYMIKLQDAPVPLYLRSWISAKSTIVVTDIDYAESFHNIDTVMRLSRQLCFMWPSAHVVEHESPTKTQKATTTPAVDYAAIKQIISKELATNKDVWKVQTGLYSHLRQLIEQFEVVSEYRISDVLKEMEAHACAGSADASKWHTTTQSLAIEVVALRELLYRLTDTVSHNSLKEEKRDDVNFGQTLEMIKAGKRGIRKGWNGKNMFIYLEKTPSGIYPLSAFEPFIVLHNAQGQFQPGWVPSQEDMLAEDWVILD